MTGVLAVAGSCFPNCHPPPGSGWDMSGGSSFAVGAIAVLLLILLLTKGGKGK
jgi:hypothetical protein